MHSNKFVLSESVSVFLYWNFSVYILIMHFMCFTCNVGGGALRFCHWFTSARNSTLFNLYARQQWQQQQQKRQQLQKYNLMNMHHYKLRHGVTDSGTCCKFCIFLGNRSNLVIIINRQNQTSTIYIVCITILIFSWMNYEENSWIISNTNINNNKSRKLEPNEQRQKVKPKCVCGMRCRLCET